MLWKHGLVLERHAMSVDHLMAFCPAVHMLMLVALQMELAWVHVLVISAGLLHLQLLNVHHVGWDHAMWDHVVPDEANTPVDHLLLVSVDERGILASSSPSNTHLRVVPAA